MANMEHTANWEVAHKAFDEAWSQIAADTGAFESFVAFWTMHENLSFDNAVVLYGGLSEDERASMGAVHTVAEWNRLGRWIASGEHGALGFSLSRPGKHAYYFADNQLSEPRTGQKVTPLPDWSAFEKLDSRYVSSVLLSDTFPDHFKGEDLEHELVTYANEQNGETKEAESLFATLVCNRLGIEKMCTGDVLALCNGDNADALAAVCRDAEQLYLPFCSQVARDVLPQAIQSIDEKRGLRLVKSEVAQQDTKFEVEGEELEQEQTQNEEQAWTVGTYSVRFGYIEPVSGEWLEDVAQFDDVASEAELNALTQEYVGLLLHDPSETCELISYEYNEQASGENRAENIQKEEIQTHAKQNAEAMFAQEPPRITIELNEERETPAKYTSVQGVNQTLLTVKEIKATPRIYNNDESLGYDAIAQVHFFCPNKNLDWYMTEYEPTEKLAYGLVCGQGQELGYFSIAEFEEMNQRWMQRPLPSTAWIERDQHFTPKPLRDLDGVFVPAWARTREETQEIEQSEVVTRESEREEESIDVEPLEDQPVYVEEIAPGIVVSRATLIPTANGIEAVPMPIRELPVQNEEPEFDYDKSVFDDKTLADVLVWANGLGVGEWRLDLAHGGNEQTVILGSNDGDDSYIELTLKRYAFGGRARNLSVFIEGSGRSAGRSCDTFTDVKDYILAHADMVGHDMPAILEAAQPSTLFNPETFEIHAPQIDENTAHELEYNNNILDNLENGENTAERSTDDRGQTNTTTDSRQAGASGIRADAQGISDGGMQRVVEHEVRHRTGMADSVSAQRGGTRRSDGIRRTESDNEARGNNRGDEKHRPVRLGEGGEHGAHDGTTSRSRRNNLSAPVALSAGADALAYSRRGKELALEGTRRERAQANIRALTLLKELEAQGRVATSDEQDVLAQYVGWGGLQECFDESKTQWSQEYGAIRELLDDEEYASARASVLTSFYTPDSVTQAIFDGLANMGFEGGRVLDPACGTGRFVSSMPSEMRERSRTYECDLDSISARITRQLNQDSAVLNCAYEKLPYSEGSFDVVVGNVPFGNFAADDMRFASKGFKIHDYFFAHALESVRPDGIVAFVTSKGTMDKANSSVRHYLAQRAEFLGAIRLPSSTFTAEAGTEVTSDIIFLKRRGEIVENPTDEWINTVTIQDKEYAGNPERKADLTYNAYFATHPEQVIGTMELENGPYGASSFCQAPEDVRSGKAAIGDYLSAAVARINGTYESQNNELNTDDEMEQERVVVADPRAQKYSFFIDDAGELWYREEDTMRKVDDISAPNEKRCRALVELRDATYHVINIQREGCSDAELALAQEELSALYDNYMKGEKGKNKSLSGRTTAAAFKKDASYDFLTALEKVDPQTEEITKGDIFYKRTILAHAIPTHADTAMDALVASIQYRGLIDLDFMSELTGNTHDELIAELGGRDMFLLPPEGDTWVSASEYLSGNVRAKLEEARQLVMAGDERFSANVGALENVLPEWIDAEDIVIELGATWIPEEIVTQFMYETLKTSPLARGDDSFSCRARYIHELGKWTIDNKTKTGKSTVVTVDYGTSYQGADAYNLLEDALNMRDKVVYKHVFDKTTYKDVTMVDREATLLAQQKQDEIRDAWHDWIYADDARRERVVGLYNRLFNSYVERTFDSDTLVFPDQNPNITLYDHQKEAIARQLYCGNTLLYHTVGAGKTFEMVAAAQEGKRLGLHSKSMFVVPHHITEQVGADYQKLYPNAKVLVATKNDFTPQNRQRLFGKIAGGDWDAVIVGRTQFEKLPMKDDYQIAYFNERKARLKAAIEQEVLLTGNRGGQTVKWLEMKKKAIDSRIDKIQARVAAGKDVGALTFEDLGIDKLFVDEAHYYKNLRLDTKMNRLAGVSTQGADKSDDMLMKTTWLNERTNYKGVTFATGTAISNSLCEMYTMQRYLQPQVLKEAGIEDFDEWASTFGKKITSVEIAPEGTGYRAKDRFARFNNVPELMSIFRQVADIKTPEMIPADDMPVPERKVENVVSEPSEYQKRYIQELSARADQVRNTKVDPRLDNMLKITHEGRILALDQRLIDPDLPPDVNNKVTQAAQNIVSIWQDTQEQRAAQVVFCDLSTPGGQMARDGGFCVYDALKERLMDAGIPEDEIAYVHDAPDDKREELFERVRQGDVRVIIGSTEKMGTGTNIQDKLIALHHLDCAWRPADMEQREGRIVRRGNTNKEVQIFRYVTSGTFDSYMYQTVENKQRFISQILNATSDVRTGEDIDERALDYAEVKALAAGNPRIKEKMELDIEVPRLKTLKTSWTKQMNALAHDVNTRLPNRVAHLTNQIEFAKRDATLAASTQRRGEGYFAGFKFEGGAHAGAGRDPKMAGEIILELVRQSAHSMREEVIGTYRGFNVTARYNMAAQAFDISVKGTGSYTFRAGQDASGVITRLDNAIDGIADHVEEWQDEIKKAQNDIEEGKVRLGTAFPREEELKAAQARLTEINRELKIDGFEEAEHTGLDPDSDALENDEEKYLDFDLAEKKIVNKCLKDKIAPAAMQLFVRPGFKASLMEPFYEIFRDGADVGLAQKLLDKLNIDLDTCDGSYYSQSDDFDVFFKAFRGHYAQELADALDDGYKIDDAVFIARMEHIDVIARELFPAKDNPHNLAIICYACEGMSRRGEIAEMQKARNVIVKLARCLEFDETFTADISRAIQDGLSAEQIKFVYSAPENDPSCLLSIAQNRKQYEVRYLKAAVREALESGMSVEEVKELVQQDKSSREILEIAQTLKAKHQEYSDEHRYAQIAEATHSMRHAR